MKVLSFRTLLVTSAAIGLAYAVSPEVRRRMKPMIDSTAQFGRRISEDYMMSAKTVSESGSEMVKEIRNSPGIEDMRSMLQSISRRLGEMEKTVKPEARKTNEYMSQYFMH